ncbi:hypothetical protein HPB51_019891 [Rhipicephalus microplus]|uniref:GH18 domain-containing protein n=1 Tax=Rhipicephalus microplus TaxID=6941 RepID=A0A9J6E3V6_RHIMP|nr:hypothetical protein HPB51_019891 [Rhipicephalus microplus]
MVVRLCAVAYILIFTTVTAAAETPNYYTFCFWDGISRFRSGLYKSSVSDIPAELCSAVVYSHVTIDQRSHWIRLTDKELELGTQVFEEMKDLKRRNPKLKILLAVGGPHDLLEKYWQFFPVVYYWKDMTESLVQWLRTYDFDGVVLDFFSGTASFIDTVRNWDKAKFIHPFVWIDRAELIVEKGASRQSIVLEVPLSARTYITTPTASGVHTVFPGFSGNYTNLQGSLASFEANMVMGRKYRGAAVRSVDLDDYNSQCAGKSNLLKGLRSTFDAAKPDVEFPYKSPRASCLDKHNKMIPTTAPSQEADNVKALRVVDTAQRSSGGHEDSALRVCQRRPLLRYHLRKDPPTVPNTPETVPVSKEPPETQSLTQSVID